MSQLGKIMDKQVDNHQTSTQLVDKVEKNDKIVQRLNKIGLALSLLVIIGSLVFLSISTVRQNNAIKKIAESNQDKIAKIDNQTKTLIKIIDARTNEVTNQNTQQNEYLSCIVSLFTKIQKPTADDLATCPVPVFSPDSSASSPATSGGAATSSPKVTSQSSPALAQPQAAKSNNSNTKPDNQPSKPTQSMKDKLLKALGL